MTTSKGFDPDDYPNPNYALDEITPDFEHWLRMDVWGLDEAIYLLLNVDPRMRAYTSKHAEFMVKFFEISDVARIAESRTLTFETPSIVCDHETGETRLGKVSPKEFIRWADSKKYQIPKPLQSLLTTDNDLISNDTFAVLRDSIYWQSLENKVMNAIDEYPKWSKDEKVSLTGNLMDWLNSKEMTNTTREAETIKKVLTDIYKINR